MRSEILDYENDMMSGGRRLVEALQRISFGESHGLQIEGFDWMFDDEVVTPFLDWFCDNVGPSNLLSDREIREFKILESSGEGILEGDQLEDALKNASVPDETEELSPEMLRDGILQMEEELKAAQLRKERLLQQRNKLSVHHTRLTHKLTKMGLVESATKNHYKKKLEQSQTDNVQMNTALERLSQATKDLLQLYHRIDGMNSDSDPSNTSHDAVFLSQQPLDHYHHTEERFTQELTGFTKKQFFEGIAELVGHDEGSRYQILDISNPSSLAIRGEKQHVTNSDCKELARLQALYPTSQRRCIKAQVEEARLLAACNFTGDKLQSLTHQGYSSSVTELSERLKEVQSKFQSIQRIGAKVAETDLYDLIQENAVLQATRVLYGDYNLKIMRQDYFTSKQDQLIEQLTNQQSRHKFLLMAYEVEAHRHRETHRLLTASEQLLSRNLQARQSRMRMMSDPSLTPPSGIRNTIDSRDMFINRLHSIIVDDKEKNGHQQLFLTYSSLLEGARQLGERLASVQEMLSSTNSSQDSRLADLESTLKRCEDMVYAGSATVDGQPVLSPPDLMNGITRLDQTLQKLEQTIRDIIGDYNNKLKVLKGDPLLARQRRLFVYFLTDPPRLRRTVSELSQRLEAQLVQ
ncbi:HAUS augmin-like complex subunit 3 [Acanthaster planci]|uniref:HAUS augmin-like complex subunit 3 n=1 Tax=Acanthaster planci TaxID=133434 RepID=A0A8B7ZPR3_ACAPL|nr:HAUS augmin-like complex subunit 3 [Acanthaster planci]XP_022105407.1 HAUS augmin-like complex subunit 3 [Acanthaster planci]XP_022105408.1 HAUS augmin-like complex subunit 3 [Acanthaster planci]XP_022105409.1 HAUS augmin-like complex subunit 3 [Acanthaster planci]XP_022105411.1 HAUS augmin-like complex subunit 3 [Acanthaster planci]